MDTKQQRAQRLADLPFTRGEKFAKGNRVIRFFPAVRPSRTCRQTVAALQRESRVAVLNASVIRPSHSEQAERLMLLLLCGLAAMAIVVAVLGVGTVSHGVEDFVRFLGELL